MNTSMNSSEGLFRPGEVEMLKKRQVDPEYVRKLSESWPPESIRKYIDSLLDKSGESYDSVAGAARDDLVGNSN